MTNTELLDKIKSEIGRLHAQHSSKYETDEAGLVLERLEDFISTLEVPSSDDLEKEVKKYISKDTPELWTGDDDYEYTSVPLCWMYDFARHFAEWGAEHSCHSEMLEDLQETACEWYEKYQFLKSIWWNEEGKTKLIDAWESFIAGAKWKESQTSQLPSRLEEAADENSAKLYCSCLRDYNETGRCDCGCANVKTSFIAGAKWQSKQEEEYINEAANGYEDSLGDNYPALQKAFISGAKWQKEQMMKEAVEGVVSIYTSDITGREYFSVHCYEFNATGKFKDGDEVRIIIVKEK